MPFSSVPFFFSKESFDKYYMEILAFLTVLYDTPSLASTNFYKFQRIERLCRYCTSQRARSIRNSSQKPCFQYQLVAIVLVEDYFSISHTDSRFYCS